LQCNPPLCGQILHFASSLQIFDPELSLSCTSAAYPPQYYMKSMNCEAKLPTTQITSSLCIHIFSPLCSQVTSICSLPLCEKPHEDKAVWMQLSWKCLPLFPEMF
jgi:hypothetical protein